MHFRRVQNAILARAKTEQNDGQTDDTIGIKDYSVTDSTVGD